MQRTAELHLQLHNFGSIPAEDVTLVLRFPKVVSLFPDGQLPPPPQQPQPPGLASPKTTKGRTPALVKPEGGIRYTRGIDTGTHWELRYHLEKLNHHLDEHLRGLYIRFPSYEAAASFTVDYRIAAINAPEPVTGSLHVIARKPEVQRRRIARRKA